MDVFEITIITAEHVKNITLKSFVLTSNASF